MRTLLQWAVFALVVYACWQVGPLYVHSRQFVERLEVIARQSLDAPDGVVVQRTLELASSLDLSLTADRVAVRRVPNHTFIDAAYTAELRVLPGVSVPWTFRAHVDGHVITPQRASDFIPGTSGLVSSTRRPSRPHYGAAVATAGASADIRGRWSRILSPPVTGS